MKKRSARIWSMVLALAMLLTMMPVSALAVDEEPATSGSCGDNVTWNFDSTAGQLTIQGTGEMRSYSKSAEVPWYGLNKQIKSVLIKDGVTHIGAYTLGALDEGTLEKVEIPSSVTSFASHAWAKWNGYFPSYDKLITAGPTGGDYNYEFEWDTEIPNNAFRVGGITKIVLPDTITKIGDHALHTSDLVDVNLPNGLKEIGDYALCSTSLTNIVIPDSVTTIGENAFQYSDQLESIKLPSSLTSIPYMMCSDCNNLKSIKWSKESEIGDWAFAGCGFTHLTIPQGVKSIGEYAFYHCSDLETVSLPDSLQSIDSATFMDCSTLKRIDFPANLVVLDGAAFSGCAALEIVELPNTITEIGMQTFSGCKSLKNITIPNNITSIKDWTFMGCNSLTSITIPDSVTSIGDSAFYSCSALTNVYYTGSKEEWDKISIGSGNTDLTDATIHYSSSESNINSMVAVLTDYDESTKQAIFGSNPTSYTYQITGETALSEDINNLLGKTVLVRYKSGEYGAPDMLTRYVLSISPAVAASGILSSAEQDSIILGDKPYSLDRVNGTATLGDLENHIGDFTVCYFYNNAIVDVRFPQKQTGTFTTGTQNNVTIDNVEYSVAFAGLAPYLSAIDLWFGQTVEYWMVDGIIYDIKLPDYDTIIYRRLEKIQDDKAYFHDSSNYQILNSGSKDYSSLVGHWVAVTLATSADGGTMLSDMRLFKPQLSVRIEMVDERNVRLKDNKYSYDGSDYVPSSKFEIGYEITIKSKVPGISNSDLVAMQEDPSMSVTLENLEIVPPDGFNSGRTGSGEIPNVSGTTVLPGETKVGKGFVRPGMWYFVDKEVVSATEMIQMKLETSVGEYEDEVVFTIMNLNYEPPKTKEEALNSRETKALIGKAADELDKLDVDSGIMITDPSLVTSDFGINEKNLARLKKELLTEVLMSSAPEDSLSDQIADNLMSKVFSGYKSPVSGSKYTVPLRYVFETPDYGMLTVQFTCNINSFTLNSSKYALYATVDYEVLQQDKDSGDKTWPPYKKGVFAQIAFADVKAYTDAAYDVAKKAIKNAYDDVWGKQADQIANFLFGDVVKAILKASKTSFSNAMWKIMTWPTENMSVACPVDIFIYDVNGNLCGSIESNQVTKTSAEFGLSVSGDVKYITGLRDDYKLLYKATGNGSMDIAITEYTGYESPLRAVTFKAVPLAQDGTYTQNIAGEVLAEVNSYKLISNTEEGDIIPDDKVVLIGWTSDGNDQEEIPTPTPEPDGNSGGSSSSSSSENRYTISVVDGIDNGFISVNPSQAESGDIVTITIDPDVGYELDALIVTDSSGNQIATEKETDTRYTFKMPRGRVSIDATFIAIEDESAPQTSGEPFMDVSSRDWFYDAVEYVYENGMMQGTSSSLFEPNGVTTRAMVVTILHRCEGETRTYKSDFTDVASNMYYADAVAWAEANGIVTGVSETSFVPNDPITREQMAAILYRYAQYKGYNTTNTNDLSNFTDALSVCAYAVPAMKWANAAGLIVGRTTTTLVPQGNATRAEAAQILMTFCENVAK